MDIAGADSAWTTEGGIGQMRDNSAMNEQTMTSAEAQEARQRSAEIMEALKNGKPGEADALMGKSQHGGGSFGVLPVERLSKMFGKKDKEKGRRKKTLL